MTLAEIMAEVAYNAFPTVLRTPTGMSHLSWAEMPEWQRKEFVNAQKAALVALMLSGRAIVPYETTPEMRACGHDYGWSGVIEGCHDKEEEAADGLYYLMLMAAPKVVV